MLTSSRGPVTVVEHAEMLDHITDWELMDLSFSLAKAKQYSI